MSSEIIQNLEINLKKKFEEVLRLVITMGGDTETIASIAGAVLRLDNIPAHLYTCCKAHQEIIEMAEEMFDNVNNKGGGDTADAEDIGPDNKKQ